MRITFFMIILLSGVSAMSQDLDYPDFRSKKDNFSKIAEKDIRGDVATFALAGVDESIGKPPLATVPLIDYGSNFVKYANDHIQVIVRTSVFLAAKHKLMQQEGHLLRIDSKPYYGGVYGEQPHITIQSITVLVDKDTVPIPPAAYIDLFDPKFGYNENGATRTRNGVFLSNDKHTFYIYMLNPDNKGVEYTWVIRDKQYARRVVDFGFLN